MGQIISLSCNSCGWVNSGCVGHGFNTSFVDINSARLPQSFLNRLDLENNVYVISAPQVLVLCADCSYIGFRTHYQADNVEALHRCGRCNKRANVVDNFEAINRCPDCLENTLSIEDIGIWD